ncbi:biotin--[acetyl-CoA-carboxylase] ligase [Rhizosphaericola mali]|uniref:Biotin--[acetyl-CoA-carboxylase] ligase n=1 Tax=Rhizosphaericola mali TaxID=2545455 RepID=A0A5P2GBM4_9BACT|nr:biotin--[acetyl-CoA-carboxylase] ligase [Rhizosphaericola mali]QES90613.1 biotin--[acetyl-CoA-carboxylase] ligase [Rhizosphaericola mali]
MSLVPTKHSIGQIFLELKEVESTNNYAMAFANSEEATHGIAVFAHHQSAGKGQRGKAWKDHSGENIAISFIIDTSALSLQYQFQIIILSGLATYDLLYDYYDEMLKIKWPNDIYFGDKKAVGILTESLVKGNKWQWTVAGIGINVNQIDFEEVIQKKATSLKLLTGKDFDTVALAKQLCEKMETRWQQLNQLGFDYLLSIYNQLLYKKDEILSFRKRENGEIFEGKIQSAQKDGKLVIQVKEQLQFFNFGEIEFIIPSQL